MADPRSLLGEKTTELLGKAPEAMAEMMREFIEKKDLNSRTSIRYRMRALLDLASADTMYPPGPMTGEPPFEDDFDELGPRPRRRRRRVGVIARPGGPGVGMAAYVQPPRPAAPPGPDAPVQPAPGADAAAIEDAAVQNEDILGEEAP